MELNTTNDTSSVKAVTRYAGSFGLTDRDPGAHASARSARQHKAWGAASAASKPQDHNPKKFQPADAGVSIKPGA